MSRDVGVVPGLTQNGASDDALANVLRCPIGHGPVRRLGDVKTRAINAAIERRELRHADGSVVTTSIDTGYASVDGAYVYPVVQGIIVMLPARAIVCQESTAPVELRDEKRGMQQFYDEIGWSKSDPSCFVDAQKWEDLRPIARDYVDRCHRRISKHLSHTGEYFLDAASGPVQYPQYRQYSSGYRKRICVDLSFVALTEAKRKLGDHGVYILGDITNLPLLDGVVDGGVSLHTIYHVPADEQARAFEELHRVLRPGATLGVVYAWAPYSLLLKLTQLPAKIGRAPMRLFGKLRHVLAKLAARQSAGDAPTRTRSRGTPYFHGHSYRWFTRKSWQFDYEIHSWRSIPVPLLRAYFHGWLLGRAMLAALFRVEGRFSRFFGRMGAYPLIVIRKRADVAKCGVSTHRRAA